MYDEKYPELVAAMDAYYEQIKNLQEGDEEPVPPLSEENYQMLTALGPYITEYAKVAEGMLAYCEAAAIQFGVEVEKENEVIQPIATYTLQETETVVKDEWESVTLETLEAYKAALHEGAVMPAGISLAGMTLVLEAHTNIRIYFNVSDINQISKYTFTVNGETVRLHTTKKTNQYFLLISGLTASDLKTMFTISVTDGESTFTFDYSAMSYAHTVLLDSNSADSLKNLARAMWVYATRTENFLSAMGGAKEGA